MPAEAPRTGNERTSATAEVPPDQAHLLEELAQVEHELEALGEYRKQLREKIEGMGVGDER